MFAKSLSGLVVAALLSAVLMVSGCSADPSGEEEGKVQASTQESAPSPAPPAAAPAPTLQVAELQQVTIPEAASAIEPSAADDVEVQAAPVAAGGTGPRIHSDEPTFDFGRVDNTEKVEHDFIVKNIGDAPLELGKAKTSCGCTVAKMAKTVLQPGEETSIGATLSLKGVEGTKNTTVTLPSNDPENPNYQLRFTGTAVASIRITPSQVSFGQVDSDALLEDKFVSVQAVPKDVSFTVTQAECTAPLSNHFTTEVEEILAGKSYKITLKNVKPLKEGPIQGQIRISTDDPARPNLDVRVYGSVVGDIVILPSRISVNYNEDPGRRTSQYIRIAAGKIKEFEVTEVISPLDEVVVEFSPRANQKQESEYLIKLTNMPVNGVLDGQELIIKTNIPGKPEIRVPFYNKKPNRSNVLIQQPRPVRPTTKANTAP